MKNIYFAVLLAFMSSFTAPAWGADAAPLRMQIEGDTVTIMLDLPGSQPPEVFTVQSPSRLLIDTQTVRFSPALSLPNNYKGKLVRSVQSGKHDIGTRIVFELSKPVKVLKAVTEISGKRSTLSVTLSASGTSPPLPAASTLKSDTTKTDTGTFDSPAAKKTSKTENPLIVVDAGHGGVDPGASGADDSFEKDIVLEYAQAVKSELLRSGKYRVQLTRDGDYFIRLRERVEIARKAGASLFISLHADSAPESSARGLSIYTVSDEASDKESEALAARENKSDVIAGLNLAEERKDVANILISLAQRETKNASSMFADKLVMSLLDQRIKLLENTHRFAGFAVLKAPDVPSVLIELGFISNPDEENLLKSKIHRSRVAAGIANGVDAYMRKRKNMGM